MRHTLCLITYFARSGLSVAGWIGGLAPTLTWIDAGRTLARQAEEPIAAPNELRTSRDYPDVYLNDSLEAAESLSLLQQFVELGNWEEAARLAEQLTDGQERSLTRIENGLYTDVKDFVRRSIAEWPPEGIAVYRKRLEPLAALSLEDISHHRDWTWTVEMLGRFFATESGLHLADHAAQMALEEGRFRTAFRIYQELLTFHPDRKRVRGDVAARLAMVFALEGRRTEAEQWAQESERIGLASLLRPLGETKGVGEQVAYLLQSAVPANPRTIAPMDWPAFAGNGERNRIADLTLTDAASLWEHVSDSEADKPSHDPGDEQSRLHQQAVERGLFLSAQPVVADGRVFVQSASRLWAVNTDNGELSWSYAPAGAEGGTPPEREGVPQWHSPCYGAGRVFAAFVGLPNVEPGETPRGTALVCLDGASGEPLWRVDQDDLGENWHEKIFDSSPLVVGDALLIIVRRQRVFGFEDCYLYRFDGDTGRIDFQTHLGGASTGGFGYRRATLSIPSTDGDLVFVNTNMGAVAAASVDTGRVRWLRLYPRAGLSSTFAGGRGAAMDVKSWHYNPVWVGNLDSEAGERAVVCLPLDSDDVLVLNADTGRMDRRIPLTQLEQAVSLLGVMEGRLYGIGATVFAYDLRRNVMTWTAPFPANESPFGRALLAAGTLYLPTRASLVLYDAASGESRHWPWDARDLGGGNLVAVGGRLLVAGQERLTAYAGKKEVFSMLNDRMAAQPENPLPALELAEIAMRNSERVMALSALEESIRRAGGFAQLYDPLMKARLFKDCMEFAGMIIGLRPGSPTEPNHALGLSETDVAAADNLYSYASQCAPDTESHLRYRLHWAEFYRRIDRPVEAVRLFQQILSDRSLRETVPDSSVPAPETNVSLSGLPRRPAGLVAEQRIEELIQKHGREIYSETETEAERRLAAAHSRDDPEALDALAESFPNSRVAARALVAKGELLRKRAKPLESARAFSAALDRLLRWSNVDPAADAPALIKQIADSYVEAQRNEDAWLWLTKGAREYPTAKVLVDGTPMSLLEYRSRLGDIEDRIGIAYPRVELPLARTYSLEFDEPATLLEPRFPDARRTQWRTILVRIGDSFRSIDARSGKDDWAAPAVLPSEADLLLSVAERYVLASRYHVTCLSLAAGEKLWSFGAVPPKVDDPNTDWESTEILRTHASDGIYLVSVHDGGQAVCLEVESGRTVWERRLESGPIGAVVVDDPWIIYQGTHQNRTVYTLLDLATGQTARMIDPDDDRQIVFISQALDGQLLLATTQMIHAIDPMNGQERWRRPLERLLFDGGVRMDLDGVYVSPDGHEIEKIGLDDGRTLWQTTTQEGRPPTLVDMKVEDGQLLAFSQRGVYSVDTVDGRVLWEGTVPPRADFESPFLLSDAYAVAVNRENGEDDEKRTVIFYDYRQSSGLIPKAGGVVRMEDIGDVKAVALRDNALIAVSERGLYAWSKE